MRKNFQLDKWALRVSKMSAPSLETAVQSLPPELREMILKKVITAKCKDKAGMGWNAVHKELEKIDTQRVCLSCSGRLVSIFHVCTRCMRCDCCNRLIEMECPLCRRLVSKDPRLCWACYEDDDDDDFPEPTQKSCFLCGGGE